MTTNPFAAPEWSRIWAETSGRELVAAPFPLVRERRVLRFPGGIDLTDYPGPGSREDASALAAWLRETELDWSELDGRFLRPTVAQALVDGFRVRSAPERQPTAVLPLPADWHAYLSGLSRRDRHELRRKRRRLREQQPDFLVRTATLKSLEGDLRTFVNLHRDAEGRKGRFMTPHVERFFKLIARTFAARDELRLDVLELGGRPAAATFGFEIGGVFYLYNSAYDPAAARLSPGIVLVSRLIERAIDRGLETFDFLRGAEPYKLRLGARLEPLVRVRLVR